MINTEKDIKILEESIQEAYRSYDYDLDYSPFSKGIAEVIERVLAERKQDKARIKELEAKNRIYVLDANRVKLELYIKENYIPKQKVKDKIERHEFAKKDFEKEYDNKNYKDDDLRARDFYMIVAEDLIIKNLKDLLEDK